MMALTSLVSEGNITSEICLDATTDEPASKPSQAYLCATYGDSPTPQPSTASSSSSVSGISMLNMTASLTQPKLESMESPTMSSCHSVTTAEAKRGSKPAANSSMFIDLDLLS